jgi:hypothetical protein
MKKFKLLIESRVEDFKSKFGRKFDEAQIKRIVDLIQPKYLDWVGKTMDVLNFDKNLQMVNKDLQQFEKISSNLPYTDINDYKTLQDLNDALVEYTNKSRRQYKKVEGGNVVYEDPRFFVVNPLTYDASCYYGRGTKWCTAANSDYNFHKYNEDGKLFYILDTALPTSDPYYKVAMLKKFDGEKMYWDAKDDTIKTGWFIGTPELEKIESSVEEYMNDFFSEQIEIFQDKERKKKELQRLESLRIQREKERTRAQIENRRSNNEWDLNDPNISEEGLKAHALQNYLESEGIEFLSTEDSLRLSELKQKLEELENKLTGDESDDEIEQEIEEIETEIEELEDKPDVYNITPTGSHYRMTTFQVFDSGISNNEYAVGDEDEVNRSVVEYVENLIDDVGYDGFSKGFAENYIDEDAVVEEAEDVYSNDVSSNPESYLDESSRELSTEQEDRINLLRTQIREYENIISKLEDSIDESDDEETIDDLKEKIEELQEQVEDNQIEIDEIVDSPEGQYKQEDIDEKVEELVDDVRKDPMWFINDMGLDINYYIDKDAFIQGVIDADGLGMLSPWDGSYDEFKVNGNWYYVMRIN